MSTRGADLECAPRGLHRICCFLTMRLLWLTGLVSGMAHPLRSGRTARPGEWSPPTVCPALLFGVATCACPCPLRHCRLSRDPCSRWVVNVSVLLEELTICVADGCANRFADEASSEGCCPSCLAFWGRPRTEQRRSPQPRSPAVAPLRGLTTMPDVKCLGADPSAVVDGLATGTEVGPPRAPGRQRRTPTVLIRYPNPANRIRTVGEIRAGEPVERNKARTARLVTEYGKGNPPCA